METNNKIKLMPAFTFFIVYSLFLLNSDVLSLVLFYIGLSDLNWMAVILSAIITLIVAFFFRRNVLVQKHNLDAMGWIVIGLIILLGTIRGILPDTSCDVARAHIFFQQVGFEDNINDNAFPAGYTFYFYLSDKFAYYFRLLLGYRMGTLANAVSLIVAFLETRSLLSETIGEVFYKIRKSQIEKATKSPIYALLSLTVNESFFAGAASLTYFAISELGTYMVDIVGLPIMVYLIRGAIKKEKDEVLPQFFFYALMSGLCFAYKQTNIILIIPVLLMYLIRHWKKLNVKIFLICMMAGVFPAAPYLLYSYISTGNPVYITYNSIFKSPYYYDEDFKDDRWGPKTFQDAVLWPIKLVFDNQTRVSEIITLPLSYILLGCITVIQAIILAIRRKKYEIRNATVKLSMIFVSCMALWLYTTGYIRYAIIVELIAVVLVGFGISNRYEINRKFKSAFSFFLIGIVILQCSANVVQGLGNNYDWSWRGRTRDNIKSGVFVDNVKWLFRDRKIGNDEQRDKVDLFLITYEGNVYATLFNPDVPIIGAANISQYLGGLENVKGINYVDKYKKHVFAKMDEGKRVFDIEKLNAMNNCIDMANAWGVEFSSIEWMDTFFVDNNELALIEYKPLVYGNSFAIFDNRYLMEPITENANKLHGFLYLPPYYTEETTTMQIMVTSSGESQNTFEFVLHCDEVFDLAQLNNDISIKSGDTVELCVIDGLQRVYAINLRLEEE